MCGAPSPGELKSKYLETDEGKQRAEFARAWAAEHYDETTGSADLFGTKSTLNKDGKPLTKDEAITFFESQFTRKEMYEGLGGDDKGIAAYRDSEAYKTWADPAKRAAFMGPRQAAKAAPDKTDVYLRNTGLKRATGSQFGSFLGGY